MRAIYLLLLSVCLITGLAWGEPPPVPPELPPAGFDADTFKAYIDGMTSIQQSNNSSTVAKLREEQKGIEEKRKEIEKQLKSREALASTVPMEAQARLKQQIEESKADLLINQADLDRVAKLVTEASAAPDRKKIEDSLRANYAAFKLEGKLSEIGDKDKNINEKLNAVERKFDQTIMGDYLREKLTRLMASDIGCTASNPAICKDGKLVTGGKSPAEIRNMADDLISPIFYSEKGGIGSTGDFGTSSYKSHGRPRGGGEKSETHR